MCASQTCTVGGSTLPDTAAWSALSQPGPCSEPQKGRSGRGESRLFRMGGLSSVESGGRIQIDWADHDRSWEQFWVHWTLTIVTTVLRSLPALAAGFRQVIALQPRRRDGLSGRRAKPCSNASAVPARHQHTLCRAHHQPQQSDVATMAGRFLRSLQARRRHSSWLAPQRATGRAQLVLLEGGGRSR